MIIIVILDEDSMNIDDKKQGHAGYPNDLQEFFKKINRFGTQTNVSAYLELSFYYSQSNFE